MSALAQSLLVGFGVFVAYLAYFILTARRVDRDRRR